VNRLERMVWVDLETTGLNPAEDVILEVAVVVTDGALNELAAQSLVVRSLSGRGGADPIVQQMHDANGLWAECAGSLISWLEAADTTREFIERHAPKYHGPICGSSPHFDKAFLDVEMPSVAALFNHRVFDVSTLKQAFAQFGGSVAQPGGHRALPDIRGSISAARFILAQSIGAE